MPAFPWLVESDPGRFFVSEVSSKGSPPVMGVPYVLSSRGRKRSRDPDSVARGGAERTLIKNYILDTNVLLHDPHSLLSFQDNTVLVPIEVIEEIDRFKRESSDRGQNARAVSRLLDALRGQGRLSVGSLCPQGAGSAFSSTARMALRPSR